MWIRSQPILPGGSAPAELVILTPDIPDTLILTEITT